MTTMNGIKVNVTHNGKQFEVYDTSGFFNCYIWIKVECSSPAIESYKGDKNKQFIKCHV